MKYIIPILACLLTIIACKTAIPNSNSVNTNLSKSDTIRIANDSLEYEVIIIDGGFNSWLLQYGKPRGYYSQSYLEARNLDWVNAWNQNFYSSRYSNLFMSSIDYQFGINYGYEVNYLLFNYLVYFQNTNKIKLGSFVARP